MPYQILLIHGGDAWETQEEYIAALKAKEVTLERLLSRDWKANLQDRFGTAVQVIMPRMPNSQNARYAEWKIYFEKIVPLFNDNLILIGHSLGGIFLAKYLSEEHIAKKIKATFFVAAPYNTAEIHPLVDFNLENDLHGVSEQGGRLMFFQSHDDQVVPFSNVKDYQKVLPTAEYHLTEQGGHFNQPSFPELEQVLETIVKETSASVDA